MHRQWVLRWQRSKPLFTGYQKSDGAGVEDHVNGDAVPEDPLHQ